MTGAPAILVSIGLLLANAFFVAMEFALIAARRTKMEQLASEGNVRARAALSSIKELSFMLAGAQLGITMASLGLGAVAEPALAHAIEEPLQTTFDASPTVVHSVAFTIALAIVVFFHMVIGEMAPKNVAIARPEGSALALAFPIRVYANLFRPFIWILNRVGNGVLRLFRVEPQDELVSVHTAGEIALMATESAKEGAIREFEHRLLTGAVGLSELDAGAVMVPRPEMVATPLTVTPVEIERLVLASGHSRFPLYRENLDDVVGFFHVKDLLKIPRDRQEQAIDTRLVRPMLVVPESLKLHPLLREMRRRRRHFALVMEEHGGTAGIVTLEDVLEELVGDIRDEHDLAEVDIERLDDKRFVVPGNLRVDEVADHVGLELPEGEYETIAGFIMDRLGRIPKRRDVLELDGWRLQVRSMHRRRVVSIVVERTGPRRVTTQQPPG